MVLDNGLCAPAIERISRNTPQRLNADVLQTPVLAPDIGVEDTVIIVAGFDCGSGHVLVPQSATRVLELYRSFYTGDVAFLDAMGEHVTGNPDGSTWTAVQRSSLCNSRPAEMLDVDERFGAQPETTTLSSQNRSRSAVQPDKIVQ